MAVVARTAEMGPVGIRGNKRRKQIALAKSSFENHIKGRHN